MNYMPSLLSIPQPVVCTEPPKNHNDGRYEKAHEEEDGQPTDPRFSSFLMLSFQPRVTGFRSKISQLSGCAIIIEHVLKRKGRRGEREEKKEESYEWTDGSRLSGIAFASSSRWTATEKRRQKAGSRTKAISVREWCQA